ncbi:hypothetical protein KDA_10860 [Dictyobacter alpinus]|uniref:Uncharacterized protein n=2 Tax=Dictyobacter alpinus TaxID=2014873 RepID=A0A402B2M3_9CHLR|nr:hypothetical protein KDA_10860 [Dictyobacter alpinus]
MPSASNKATAAGASTAPRPVAPPPPPKPKAVKGGTNQWLDSLSDVKVGEPDTPPVRPKLPSPPVQRDRRGEAGDARSPRPNGSGGTGTFNRDAQNQNNRGNGPVREPATYAGSNGTTQATVPGQRPPYRPAGPGRGPAKLWAKNAGPGGPKPARKPKPHKPAPAPKPKREKTPPPEPFTPTEEQIKQVEERYTLLAQPAEFDGIRTQISKEFNIPKKAVKKIIKDLRDRQHIPSWWEVQTYKGSQEELERIKEVYQPFLPVPPVGVHKTISDTLNLKPGTVYQAIKTIRTEMNLPQYNDPKYHEEELAEHRKRLQAKKEAAAAAKATTAEPTTSTTTEQPAETQMDTVPSTTDSSPAEEAQIQTVPSTTDSSPAAEA